MSLIHEDFPFAKDFIKDSNGYITDVILDRDQYKRLIGELEDEGLYRAMKEIEHEEAISVEQALSDLEGE